MPPPLEITGIIHSAYPPISYNKRAAETPVNSRSVALLSHSEGEVILQVFGWWLRHPDEKPALKVWWFPLASNQDMPGYEPGSLPLEIGNLIGGFCPYRPRHAQPFSHASARCPRLDSSQNPAKSAFTVKATGANGENPYGNRVHPLSVFPERHARKIRHKFSAHYRTSGAT